MGTEVYRMDTCSVHVYHLIEATGIVQKTLKLKFNLPGTPVGKESILSSGQRDSGDITTTGVERFTKITPTRSISYIIIIEIKENFNIIRALSGVTALAPGSPIYFQHNMHEECAASKR